MTSREQRARKTIDQRLNTAGWHIQDYADLNLAAARGIAVCEFPLRTGFADYLLFVDRKAIGAVEKNTDPSDRRINNPPVPAIRVLTARPAPPPAESPPPQTP